MIRRPPRSPLFPYPPLFRSRKTLASLDTGTRRRHRRREDGNGEVAAEDVRTIRATEFITVAELANLMEVKPQEVRSEEHTSELQSPCNIVCRLLLEKKKITHLAGPEHLVAGPGDVARPAALLEHALTGALDPSGRLRHVQTVRHQPAARQQRSRRVD